MAGAVKLAIILTATMGGADAFDKAGGGIAGMGAAVKKALPMLKAFAAFAALEFLKDSIKVAMEFEQVMAEAGSIIGATRDEIRGFATDIRAMSQEIPKTPQDLGLALYDIFSAGITDVDEALGALRLSAQAASAGLTETATAAKAGIATMNAFGMEAADLTHIFDTQFLTIRFGILRYGELADVIGMLAPAAKTAGQSMESMFAGLALLTKKGLDARMAATALARAMEGITKPSAIRAAAEIGISFIELTEDARGARDEYVEQKLALDDLTASYDEVNASVKALSEQMAKVTLEEAKNRLEIAKIKRDAQKGGRELNELTDEEIARIKELEIANTDLAISYDELSVAQMESKINADDINNSMAEQAIRADEAKAAFDEQIELTGKFRPLVDIVAELNDKYGDLGESAKADIISQLFPEIRAKRAIMSILGSEEELMETTDLMMNQAGAMGEAYAINTDTAAAGYQLMKNSITDLKIEMGEALIPVMEEFIPILKEEIIPMLRNSLIPLRKSETPAISAVGSAVGWLAGLFADYPELLFAIVGGYIALKIAVLASNAAMLANPIMLIVIAVAALVLVVKDMIDNWDVVKEGIDAVWGAIKKFASGVMSVIQPIIDGVQWLVDLINEVIGGLKSIATEGIGGVRGKVGDLLGFQEGGIATGPASGYPVMLHGTEAVIPMRNGSIPVEIMGGVDVPVGAGGVTQSFDSHDTFEFIFEMGKLDENTTPEQVVEVFRGEVTKNKKRGILGWPQG